MQTNVKENRGKPTAQARLVACLYIYINIVEGRAAQRSKGKVLIYDLPKGSGRG